MITIENLRHYFPYLRTDIMRHNEGNYGIWEERGWHWGLLFSDIERLSYKLSFRKNTIYIVDFRHPHSGWLRAHSPWNDFYVLFIPEGSYNDGYERYCTKAELKEWLTALNILAKCKKLVYPECDVFLAPQSMLPGKGLKNLLNRIIGGINHYSVNFDETWRWDGFYSLEECKETVLFYDNLSNEAE